MIGLDGASHDYGLSTDYPVHVKLLGANIPFLENVAHLDRLAAELNEDDEKRPKKRVEITALPMNIGEGSGGPTRIMAKIINSHLELSQLF